MKKQVIAAFILSAIVSLFLVSLSYDANFREFERGIIGEFIYDDGLVLFWIIVAASLAALTVPACTNEFRKRLAISGFVIIGLLVWLVSHSVLVTVVVMLPALCVGALLWAFDAKR